MKRKRGAKRQIAELKELIRAAKTVATELRSLDKRLADRLGDELQLHAVAAERNALQMALDLLTRPPTRIDLSKRKDIAEAVTAMRSVVRGKVKPKRRHGKSLINGPFRQALYSEPNDRRP